MIPCGKIKKKERKGKEKKTPHTMTLKGQQVLAKFKKNRFQNLTILGSNTMLKYGTN